MESCIVIDNPKLLKLVKVTMESTPEMRVSIDSQQWRHREMESVKLHVLRMGGVQSFRVVTASS